MHKYVGDSTIQLGSEVGSSWFRVLADARTSDILLNCWVQRLAQVVSDALSCINA